MNSYSFISLSFLHVFGIMLNAYIFIWTHNLKVAVFKLSPTECTVGNCDHMLWKFVLVKYVSYSTYLQTVGETFVFKCYFYFLKHYFHEGESGVKVN